jgi:hypothetical protein
LVATGALSGCALTTSCSRHESLWGSLNSTRQEVNGTTRMAVSQPTRASRIRYSRSLFRDGPCLRLQLLRAQLRDDRSSWDSFSLVQRTSFSLPRTVAWKPETFELSVCWAWAELSRHLSSAGSGLCEPGGRGRCSVAAGILFTALVIDSRGLDSAAPWPKYQHDVRNTGNPTTPIQSCP